MTACHCNGAHLKHPLKIMRWPFSLPVTWKQSISHRGPLAETEVEPSGRRQLLRVDLLNNLLLSLVRLLSWSPAENPSKRQRASGYSKHLTYNWRTLKQHIWLGAGKVFGTAVFVCYSPIIDTECHCVCHCFFLIHIHNTIFACIMETYGVFNC